MGERIVVIDADIALRAGVELAGWRLEQPPTAEFDRLAPPGHLQPWDSATRSGRCCVLRRPDPAIVAPSGTRLPRGVVEDLTATKLRIAAWAPLLLLNLWGSNDPVRVAVEYDVDPGRHVEKARGGGLEMVPVFPDDEYEEPVLGPLRVDAAETDTFLRFLTVLASYLRAVPQLEDSAHIFLSVGSMVWARGDVTFPRNRPEVVYRYVAAVEHLLVCRNEDSAMKATLLSERTAILLEADDDHRRSVAAHLAEAYRIRNSVAHGDPSPAVEPGFPAILRDLVRRVFARLIVLGPDFDPPRDLRKALRSEDFRARRIGEPIRASLESIGRPAAGERLVGAGPG